MAANESCVPDGARKPKRPRLTTRERAERNARVVAARDSGVRLKRIAGEFGLSTRQVQYILSHWDNSDVETLGTGDAFGALLALLPVAAETYAVIAQTATNDANRIGAMKAAVDTAIIRWNVERHAGLAPRHPAAPLVAAEMQLAMRELVELLRKHEVPEAVLADFRLFAEKRMGQQAVMVAGRQLPSAA